MINTLPISGSSTIRNSRWRRHRADHRQPDHKIVTAPFAVLGAIIGGPHSEQLAYVEFAPGHAELSADSEIKLRSLAKALTDRPALKLDAAGRAIPDVDRDGLKRVTLDRAMRTQKQKFLVAQGESAPAIDTLKIEAAEYPKYLALYRDADIDKPRNVIGVAKDVHRRRWGAALARYCTDDEEEHSLATAAHWPSRNGLVGPGAIVGACCRRLEVERRRHRGKGARSFSIR